MNGKMPNKIIVKHKHLVRINKALRKISKGKLCLHPVIEVVEAPLVHYEYCHTCGLNMRYAYLDLKIALALASTIMALIALLAISYMHS